MIIGIGVDLISINRIEKLMNIFENRFAEKIFSANEIKRANEISSSREDKSRQVLFYAKRFAAKEAFAKALGLGIGRGVNFQDIEVFNDSFGKPEITLLNNKDEFLKDRFNCNEFKIHLSLTDEKLMASAFVVIEKIL